MRIAELDAVTFDAFGTLVGLCDPGPALARLTGRPEPEVRAAFAVEAAYYRAHSHEGRDAATLSELRRRCAGVLSQALGVAVDAEAFVGALEYCVLDGVRDALEWLRARGLALAVVANWDVALPEHLERLGLQGYFAAIVTSAGAGTSKPEARIFEVALEHLGVPPRRALHIGDDDADERGAAAAGMAFLPAPVARAVDALR